MTFRTTGPGCVCSLPCSSTVFSGASRSLDDWEQVHGSWSQNGAQIRTDDANALLIEKAEAPEGTGQVQASFLFGGDPDGNKVRVIGAYSDPNNYLFVEYTRYAGFYFAPTSPSHIALYERSGGVERLIQDVTLYYPIPYASNLNSVNICWNGLAVSAAVFLDTNNLDGLVSTVVLGGASSLTGRRAGLGAGNVVNPGAIYFGRNEGGPFGPFGAAPLFFGFVNGHQACAQCIGCENFCEDEVPDTLEVEFPADLTGANLFPIFFDPCDGFCADVATTLAGQTVVCPRVAHPLFLAYFPGAQPFWLPCAYTFSFPQDPSSTARLHVLATFDHDASINVELLTCPGDMTLAEQGGTLIMDAYHWRFQPPIGARACRGVEWTLPYTGFIQGGLGSCPNQQACNCAPTHPPGPVLVRT